MLEKLAIGETVVVAKKRQQFRGGKLDGVWRIRNQLKIADMKVGTKLDLLVMGDGSVIPGVITKVKEKPQTVHYSIKAQGRTYRFNMGGEQLGGVDLAYVEFYPAGTFKKDKVRL